MSEDQRTANNDGRVGTTGVSDQRLRGERADADDTSGRRTSVPDSARRQSAGQDKHAEHDATGRQRRRHVSALVMAITCERCNEPKNEHGLEIAKL